VRQREVGLVVPRAAAAHLDAGVLDRHREHARAGKFTVVRRTAVGRATRHDAVGQAPQAARLVVGVGDFDGAAEHHGRTVIDRMRELRARQHQAIEHGDREAARRAAGERCQQPAGHAAVQQDALAVARMQHRDRERLAVDHERDVGEEGRIEHGVQALAVVGGAFRVAADAVAVGALRGCLHGLAGDGGQAHCRRWIGLPAGPLPALATGPIREAPCCISISMAKAR